jgi:hypothetical protein
MNESTREWSHRLNAENRQRAQDIKLRRGCEEPTCVGHQHHPRALEFDHVRGEKTRSIALMLGQSMRWEVIAAEIAKCDVVCANCHAVRTDARPKPWVAESRVAA